MAYLIPEQPIRTAGMAVFPYSAALESICAFTTKFDEPVQMSVRVGNTLHVPRQLAPVGKEDFRVSKTPVAINCKVGPKSEEQAQVIGDSVELLKKKISHVFEAPTGFGKTYCGCAIAAQLGQPTLIVVPKVDLIHEWRKTLINLIGVPAEKIGTIQQDVCEYKGKQFVIGVVHSLTIPDRYPPEVFNYFGMLIVDEVHRIAADGFVRIFQLVPALYRLGLSATCYRSDGKWDLVEAHIGRVMVLGTTVPMIPKILIKKTGWKVPTVKRTVNGITKSVPIPHTAGRLMSVYKAMANDLSRNFQIIEFIEQAYQAGRNIVVMADTLEHLGILYQLSLKHVPADQMGYYTGSSSETAKKAAKEKLRLIFATYKMCAEGTDAPRWDTLVLASPRADVKQSVGRVIRFMEGKKEPVVLDLVDDAPILIGYGHKRHTQYFQLGAKIIKV